ncbi:MAG: alpha-2-macroglobulin family protein, partial [Flavobacteriales bacterium]
PEPHPHFYAKEALGVRTWDMFDNVIGAYGIPIDKLLSIGGDGEVENTSKNRANRFKPVVRFIGPFKLNKGKKTTHQLKMDNYIGDVRVMLVACTKTAYGHADTNIKVKKPLMVLATLPRVVGPEEEVMLPVNVFAMEDNIKNVDVKVITNEFFTLENKTAKITFAEKGDQVITFPMKVASKTGIAKVKVEVSSGSEKSYFDIELDVRNPNPYMQHFEEKVVQGGQSWSTEFDLIGIEGTNDIALEVSYLPSLNLERRLNSLLRYPHGCVEQTTSKAFPQLFLNAVVELTDQQNAVMESNISNAIKRLALFQTSDGGLGYWPGASAANEWGTSYAGHFLLEAEKAGYEFPSVMKQNWLKYQKNQSRAWRRNTNDNQRYTDLMQAYRLYTLALAGEGDLSAMNRLRETTNLSLQSKWRLAAAYALIGQKKAAKDMVNEIG